MSKFKKGDLVRLYHHPERGGMIEANEWRMLAGAQYAKVRILTGQVVYWPLSELVLVCRLEEE